jgi:hypothetical protein
LCADNARFDFILVLFSFVFVCRDLVASRRRQHIVFGRRRLKLIVRRDEQDREARRIGERTCFGRSRLVSPCVPETFTIKV